MKRRAIARRAGSRRLLHWALGAALFVALGLCWTNPVTAQADVASQQNRERLELQKLDLEIKRLTFEIEALSGWRSLIAASLGLAGGILGSLAAFWVSRLTRRGTLTLAVHQKRLECYPKLVAATEPFAVYFPDPELLGPHHCRAIGQALRKWYFEDGGVLMSKSARDAYFLLSDALTRASTAETLAAARSPNVDELVLRDYRRMLGEYYKLNFDSPTKSDVAKWPFGPVEPSAGDIGRALQAKDYVFLQQLSSLLRTSLAVDLHSRRRPH